MCYKSFSESFNFYSQWLKCLRMTYFVLLLHSWPMWAVDIGDSHPLVSVGRQSDSLSQCAATAIGDVVGPSWWSAWRSITLHHSLTWLVNHLPYGNPLCLVLYQCLYFCSSVLVFLLFFVFFPVPRICWSLFSMVTGAYTFAIRSMKINQSINQMCPNSWVYSVWTLITSTVYHSFLPLLL